MAADLIPGQDVPNALPWPTETIHCSACNKHLPADQNVIGWSENGQGVVACDDACAARWRAAHPIS
jgi:hypothetical protein